MKEMKRFQEDNMTSLKIYCAIHLSGPFIADLVREPVPIFDLIGAQLDINQFIGRDFPAGHIFITHNVHEYLDEAEWYDLSYFAPFDTREGVRFRLFDFRESNEPEEHDY